MVCNGREHFPCVPNENKQNFMYEYICEYIQLEEYADVHMPPWHLPSGQKGKELDCVTLHELKWERGSLTKYSTHWLFVANFELDANVEIKHWLLHPRFVKFITDSLQSFCLLIYSPSSNVPVTLLCARIHPCHGWETLANPEMRTNWNQQRRRCWPGSDPAVCLGKKLSPSSIPPLQAGTAHWLRSQILGNLGGACCPTSVSFAISISILEYSKRIQEIHTAYSCFFPSSQTSYSASNEPHSTPSAYTPPSRSHNLGSF